MWWLRPLAVGLLCLAAWGAWTNFIDSVEERGAIEERAKQAEKDLKIEADIARANQEGKLAALRMLQEARARNQVLDAKANSDALEWRLASDERAKVDRDYALAREVRVHQFDADRLRELTLVDAHTNGRGLSTGTAIPAGANVPAVARTADDGWFGRLRGFLDRADPTGTQKSGAGTK